jgi:hypothetical protein
MDNTTGVRTRREISLQIGGVDPLQDAKHTCHPAALREDHTEPRFHPVLFWRLREINLKIAKSFGSPYNEFNGLKTNAAPHHSLLKITASSPHPWIDCLCLFPVNPEIFRNGTL